MKPRDLLSPELASDPRARQTPMLTRIFVHDLYEVFLGLYPNGLVGALVHYRRETLRIMVRVGEVAPGSATSIAVDLLRSAGRAPFELILDAKQQCKITLTLHDRAALKMAGVAVPRSVGRHRELFDNIE